MTTKVSAITIARMSVEDIAATAEIERLCFTTPWTTESLNREMSQDSTRHLVARLEGDVVGHMGMWFIGEESHITALAVHPDHRGRKIGERLLIAGITEALTRGIDRMTLEVRSSNQAAQSLYRKYGFIPIALRKKYYEKEGEDAVIMWVDQIGTPAYLRKLSSLRDALGQSAR